MEHKELHPTLKRIADLCYGVSVEFRINNNANTLLTVSRKKNSYTRKVSIHSIFLNAPDEVIESVANFVNNIKTHDKGIIKRFITENLDKIERRNKNSKQIEISAQGKCYNLQHLLEKLSNQYFGGKLREVPITWGAQKTATRKRARSLNFGSYSYTDNLIRIHPVLDNYYVPRYFIEFIIYHEMLHALLPPKINETGQTRYHYAEFKKKEREFIHYDKCQEWQKRNLSLLLKMSKNPVPLRQFAFG